MEGGTEAAEGTYTYGAKGYSIEERESEVWSVLDGEQLLGTVRAAPADERGVQYAVDVPGDIETEDVPTPNARLRWNTSSTSPARSSAHEDLNARV
jgi:hypothetical protein